MLVLFELLCMAIIVLWYFVLPFCLMNPKGEKNSLIQVLQLIFTEVANMIQRLNSLVQVLQLIFTEVVDMIQRLNLQVHQF